MCTNLHEQLATIQTEYISYSYPIASVALNDLFAKSDAYQGERFFWQSADKKVVLLGLGQLEVLQGKTTEEIQAFQTYFFEHSTILPTEVYQEPLLFGGFAFDSSGKTESFWNELEKGYFQVPLILFSQQEEQCIVTLTVRNQEHVETVFQQLEEQVCALLALPASEQVTPAPDIQATELGIDPWLTLVDESVQAIQAGALKKVVLARQMKLSTTGKFDSAVILNHLLDQQPNTYVFVLEGATRCFIGATPERLIEGTPDYFATASVAGSIKRGTTLAEDERLGQSLLNDAKNSHEHGLVVNRIEQELAPFIDELTLGARRLLKNRDIQHIYLPLFGKRKKGRHLLQCVQTLHPTPALGGEPREAAMQWLAEHEVSGRGLYGAPIGWLSLKEDIGEFAVGIRSGVFSEGEGLLYAGCGIVGESIAKEEEKETRMKFQPMLRGVKGIESSKSYD